MERRTLGRTGMQVSLLGMGTGGHNCLGQRFDPPVPETEIHQLLHGVFDLGINLFDTAPGYEESEAILGRALRALPRDEIIVSTKVALTGESERGEPVTPASAEEIAASVETSLRRLQLDVIDLMLITVGERSCYDTVFDGPMEAVRALQAQGKVRFIGTSEISRRDGAHEWHQHALPKDCLDVIMIGHNMINQSAQQSIFPVCLERNVGVMNIFTVRNVFRDPVRLTEVIGELVAQDQLPPDFDQQHPFGWLLEDPDVGSLVEAAYRYAAYTPGVSTVMCGTITLDRVRQNIAGLAKGALHPDQIRRLEETFGHLCTAVGN